MAVVLVTGGTGHLGRDITSHLTRQGHGVRVLARQPGADSTIEWVEGDLATGAGIEKAVSGVDTVVHAATHSPAAQRGHFQPSDFVRSPTDVDIDGTRHLLEAATQADIKHFLHISIVGVRLARVPYSRVKAAAEDLVRGASVPWSIVSATPFYWLLARMFDRMTSRRIWPLPSNLLMQPCDSADFADYVAACLDEGPLGVRDGFAGPQIAPMTGFARQYLKSRGIDRRVVGVPLPGFLRRAAGPQTCPRGRRGDTTWAEWLATPDRS
jgi:uncharacterized protein YbjT (DUF2867 family)